MCIGALVRGQVRKAIGGGSADRVRLFFRRKFLLGHPASKNRDQREEIDDVGRPRCDAPQPQPSAARAEVVELM